MTKFGLLKALSEIGAAVLVIVSLAFIYQELEQNTKATQDASYQQFLSNLTGMDLAEAADPELIRISSTAESEPESLSKEEWARFARIASGRIAQMEYAHMSRSNGTMSDLHWQAVEPHIGYLLCLPGYRMHLESDMGQIFSESFLQFLRTEIYPQCRVIPPE
ncbi:MAG: hypothetical protein ACI9ON_002353 [Limisphaerales bacterium]|jgi:hypothetical protein